jgi:hypothetical protein
MCYSKAFHGLEVEDVSGFDLGLMLCLLLIGRKMKRKKRVPEGGFYPRARAGCAAWNFHSF